MHAAFLAYVKQVLMPILIGDSVIMDNPAGRRLVTIVSGITDVSFGSKPEVSDGHENVGFRGQSGSRFRATGCLFIAISGTQRVTPAGPPCEGR